MSYNNSHAGSNPTRTGLSVQELKQLTAMRMSHTHTPNESKNRQSSSKEFSGHPPRNPSNTPSPAPRQNSAPYSAPQLESKQKNRNDSQHTQHSKPIKNKGRGRTSPVDASAGVMPHGLTVQELKELTRIRLAREAVNGYSPEASEYSDARTHTTSATFRSGYTAGDVDSYSDSGSVHRNRSTSTSPISNTDSDSFEESYSRYPPYHPSLPISPSSINRLERERQMPYSPEHSNSFAPSSQIQPQSQTQSQIQIHDVPRHNLSPHSIHQFSSNTNNQNHNNNINKISNIGNNGNNGNQKSFAGIHPGLQSQSIRSPTRDPPSDVHFYDHQDRTIPREDHVQNIVEANPQLFFSINSGNPQQIRPTNLVTSIERDRETVSSSNIGGGGNSLRKFALTNTMNSLETSYDTLSTGSATPPLNPLFSFTAPPIGELSPPGSPQRTFRGKKKLVIDCPAPVRIRSTSDCNELALEMAEAVLNSPGPNSPMNGSGKPIWSDPPSRRTSTCSIHSDSGLAGGVLHDSNGIGLSVPTMVHSESDNQNSNINTAGNDIWKIDLDRVPKNSQLALSPVALHNLSTSFHSAVSHGVEQTKDNIYATSISEFQWK